MSNQIYTIDEIRDKVRPIAVKHGVDKIYLFGSYARGDATASSDIDLCAELEESLDKGLDLITVKSLDYSEDKAFLNNVQKERVLIYAQ